jgi:hypothetical protein
MSAKRPTTRRTRSKEAKYPVSPISTVTPFAELPTAAAVRSPLFALFGSRER